jgi:hypothetical protein
VLDTLIQAGNSQPVWNLITLPIEAREVRPDINLTLFAAMVEDNPAPNYWAEFRVIKTRN